MWWSVSVAYNSDHLSFCDHWSPVQIFDKPGSFCDHWSPIQISAKLAFYYDRLSPVQISDKLAFYYDCWSPVQISAKPATYYDSSDGLLSAPCHQTHGTVHPSWRRNNFKGSLKGTVGEISFNSQFKEDMSDSRQLLNIYRRVLSNSVLYCRWSRNVQSILKREPK